MKNQLLLFTIFLCSISIYAQSGRISGKITTTQNDPLPSVNIDLLGTGKGTSTDTNGNFTFNNLNTGNYKLKASYVGYNSKIIEITIQANQLTNLGNIVLSLSEEQLSTITLNAQNQNKFTREKSFSVSKMPLKDIENPQVYTTITSELLQEQVITNFDDALKNAPGIDKLWESTGRGGDGAGYFSLRGFAVQPTLVNGLPSLTNGSPDPANVERIEVIKGPSGTLFGSSLISYGGLINVNTKRPYNNFGGSISYTSASYGLNRVTADINAPLSTEKNINLRVNTAYHTQNSFQDAGFRKSFFFAPSLSYEVNDKLSFFVNTEFYTGKSTNQTMLFLDRGAELRVHNIEELGYDHKRSYTGNDLYMETPTYSLQAQMNYKLSDSWTSQTVLSRSSAKSEGYYSYLYESTQYTPVTEAIVLSRYITRQNSETIGTDIQQNFIGDFKIGDMRNRIVVGLDYFNRSVVDNSSPYVGNGMIYIGNNLQQFNEGVLGIEDPANYTDDSGVLTQPGTDALLANGKINPSKSNQEIFSAYASDVFNILPQLSAMASLRADRFSNDSYAQTAFSPKFGLVYQPIMEKVSLFANYMNGFSNLAPVTENTAGVISTRSLNPEHANQWEVGTKLNLFNDKLSGSISYYNITVQDVALRIDTDAQNYYYVQNGEQESKGIEFSFTANPVPGLNIIAGYSYNDSDLVKGDADFANKRPESAGPKNLANLWASYSFPEGDFKGFGAGFGGNYASENMIFNRNLGGTFTLPEYTI
ncbi:MAG: TonB-dependent receptor, partial [Leeuwenhoekiella sp.]